MRATVAPPAAGGHLGHGLLLPLFAIALTPIVSACNNVPGSGDIWLASRASGPPGRAFAQSLERAGLDFPAAVILTRSRVFRDSALFEAICKEHTGDWGHRFLILFRDRVHESRTCHQALAASEHRRLSVTITNNRMPDAIYGIFSDASMMLSPSPNTETLGAIITMLSSADSLNVARSTFLETLELSLAQIATDFHARKAAVLDGVFLFDSICLTCPSGIEMEAIVRRAEARGTGVLLLVPSEYSALIGELEKRSAVYVIGFVPEGELSSLVLEGKVLGLGFPFPFQLREPGAQPQRTSE